MTDRGAAGVGVRAGQRQLALAGLLERTVPAHDSVEGHIVATVEHQGAVVRHVPCDPSGRGSIAKLQRAMTDRGTTGVGVGASQSQRALAGLLE